MITRIRVWRWLKRYEVARRAVLRNAALRDQKRLEQNDEDL